MAETSALVNIVTDKFMPEILVTIQRLLPETTGCGNFKTTSVGSITAVASISGKQNINT
jgi:hypothetical protein